MPNLEAVRAEFARQAETFEQWAVRADEGSSARIVAALGEAANGSVLDVACGPGIISAAVAPHAASVTAFDATEAMLARARERCDAAGLTNVAFDVGDAHELPYESGQFDGVMSRLAVHHFADPGRAIQEMARVSKPGGVLVIADITVSDIKANADLQNAIEILRDPSHVAMLPERQLVEYIEHAGTQVVTIQRWEQNRAFDEWVRVVNDASRRWPLEIVVGALIDAGRHAGMGLRRDEAGRISFVHQWCLVAGRKGSHT